MSRILVGTYIKRIFVTEFTAAVPKYTGSAARHKSRVSSTGHTVVQLDGGTCWDLSQLV